MLKKINSLPSSEDIKNGLPLSEDDVKLIGDTRSSIGEIIQGKSKRKIVIVGPCSVDFEDSVLEYSDFIKNLRRLYKDRLEIIMRFYTAKPRTTVGWKGLLHQVPGHNPNMAFGIHQSRLLAKKVLENGVPIADELLYPDITAQYMDDLYSYLAIGARSSENQFHREVASGMDGIPVGVKNTTSGDTQVLVDSVKAVRSPAAFALGSGFYESSGNPLAHAVLRGSNSGPNANYSHLLSLKEISERNGLNGMSVVVDASHGNSMKDHLRQPEVVTNLKDELEDFNGIGIAETLKGFMIESYLKAGNQPYMGKEAVKGLSMTDKCLGLEDTKELIDFIYKNF